jgi:hypothetical protein
MTPSIPREVSVIAYLPCKSPNATGLDYFQMVFCRLKIAGKFQWALWIGRTYHYFI